MVGERMLEAKASVHAAPEDARIIPRNLSPSGKSVFNFFNYRLHNRLSALIDFTGQSETHLPRCIVTIFRILCLIANECIHIPLSCVLDPV